MDNITKDPAYNAVDPSDFSAMIAPERYSSRSTAFDKIIAASHEHFWIRWTRNISTSARRST